MKAHPKIIGMPKYTAISQPLTVVRPSSVLSLKNKMEVEEMEKEGKKVKRQTKVPADAKAPKVEIKKPSEAEVLEAMEVGVCYTSTQISDKFSLDKEVGRGVVRKIMRKLAIDKKVRITETTEAKRKQYLYELVEK